MPAVPQYLLLQFFGEQIGRPAQEAVGALETKAGMGAGDDRGQTRIAFEAFDKRAFESGDMAFDCAATKRR